MEYNAAQTAAVKAVHVLPKLSEVPSTFSFGDILHEGLVTGLLEKIPENINPQK